MIDDEISKKSTSFSDELFNGGRIEATQIYLNTIGMYELHIGINLYIFLLPYIRAFDVKW